MGVWVVTIAWVVAFVGTPLLVMAWFITRRMANHRSRGSVNDPESDTPSFRRVFA